MKPDKKSVGGVWSSLLYAQSIIERPCTTPSWVLTKYSQDTPRIHAFPVLRDPICQGVVRKRGSQGRSWATFVSKLAKRGKAASANCSMSAPGLWRNVAKLQAAVASSLSSISVTLNSISFCKCLTKRGAFKSKNATDQRQSTTSCRQMRHDGYEYTDSELGKQNERSALLC